MNSHTFWHYFILATFGLIAMTELWTIFFVLFSCPVYWWLKPRMSLYPRWFRALTWMLRPLAEPVLLVVNYFRCLEDGWEDAIERTLMVTRGLWLNQLWFGTAEV